MQPSVTKGISLLNKFIMITPTPPSDPTLHSSLLNKCRTTPPPLTPDPSFFTLNPTPSILHSVSLNVQAYRRDWSLTLKKPYICTWLQQFYFLSVFQYKIATQILPTNDYLKHYRVNDSNVCQKCYLEFDSIEHNLFSCSEIVQILSKFFKFLNDECGVTKNIRMVQYLFWLSGSENTGLNHILL